MLSCCVYLTHLLQVSTGSAGDLSLTKDDLLSGTATQGTDNAGKDLLLADQGGVLTCGQIAEADGEQKTSAGLR